MPKTRYTRPIEPTKRPHSCLPTKPFRVKNIGLMSPQNRHLPTDGRIGKQTIIEMRGCDKTNSDEDAHLDIAVNHVGHQDKNTEWEAYWPECAHWHCPRDPSDWNCDENYFHYQYICNHRLGHAADYTKIYWRNLLLKELIERELHKRVRVIPLQ